MTVTATPEQAAEQAGPGKRRCAGMLPADPPERPEPHRCERPIWGERVLCGACQANGWAAAVAEQPAA
jgi:hypothetical protein